MKFFPRLFNVSLLGLALTASGCVSTQTPAPPAKEDPPPVIQVVKATEETPLTLNDVKDKIAVSEYRFAQGTNPQVSFKLENKLAEEKLIVEVSTEFLLKDSNVVLEQSPWVRFEMEPKSTSQYFSNTWMRRTDDARVSIRLVRVETQ